MHFAFCIIKYWFKLVNTDNIILKTVYNQAVLDSEKGHTNWVSNIKTLLNDFGFTYVFENARHVDMKVFLPEFKERVLDNFKQEWHSKLHISSVLSLYKNVKQSLDYELYLDSLPRKLRVYISRLRLCGLPLRIQTGRYVNPTPREERHCLYCNTSDIEDEFHFVCICSCYSDLRKRYLKKCYYIKPSVYKFMQLLNSKNKDEMIKLAIYVKEAIAIRNSLLTIER